MHVLKIKLRLQVMFALSMAPLLSGCISSGTGVDGFFGNSSSGGSSTPSDTTVGCGGTQKRIKIIGASSNGEVGSQSIQVGSSVTLRAGLFTLTGTFVEEVEVYWSISNASFPSSNLSITSGTSKTVTFTPTTVGSTLIEAAYDGSDDCVGSRSDITGDILVTSNAVPASLTIVAGDNQSVTVNNTLPTQLKVIVLDAFSQPVPASGVNFSVSQGDGSISGSASVTTALDGTASVSVIAGCTAGTNKFRATSAANGALTAEFTATGVVGSIDHLTFTTNPANAFANQAYGTQPVVEARDVCENSLAATAGSVTLSVFSGGGALIGVTNRTLSSGVATFTGVGNTAASGASVLRATWSVSGAITGDSASFVVAAAPPGACLVNNASFTTTLGGCQDVTSGLVWSAKASTMYTWAESVWDSTLIGNAAIDAGDFGRTSDYDPSTGCSGSCDDNSLNYCHDLNEGGQTDWRLPTSSELTTLRTNAGGSAGTYIPGVASENLHTATTNAANSAQDTQVNLSTGATTNAAKSTTLRVYCVRGGRTAADRLVVTGGASANVMQNTNSLLYVRVRDSSGNNAAVSGVPITMTTNLGSVTGTVTRTTDSSGMATFTSWSLDTVGSATLNLAATGYSSGTQILTVNAASSMHGCLVNNTSFATADGGCKDFTTGLVWSRAYNATWHQAIWDSLNPGGNVATDANDAGNTNDYEGGTSSVGYLDTSTTNVCHDLNQGGYANWRVPTRAELVAVSGTSANTYFNFTTNASFWSSRPAFSGGNAVSYNLSTGSPANVNMSLNINVTCVHN